MPILSNLRVTLFENVTILLGLLFVLVGFTVQDTLGASTILASLGIALFIAGMVYALTTGSTLLRYSLTFVALVTAQLVAFEGPIRLLGVIGLVVVIVGILYSRIGVGVSTGD